MAREPDSIPDDTLRVLGASRIGPATVRRLRDVFGDAGSDAAAADAAICRAEPSAFAAIDGVSAATARAIRRALDDADPAGERRAMQREGAALIQRGDDDYPALLAEIPQAPEALWVRGAPAARPDDQAACVTCATCAIAIVGARRCTSYGVRQAARFAGGLAAAGVTVVSGGARGVDAESHRAALRAGGHTVAVLGCGLAVDYPRGHRRLFDAMVDAGGAVVSEFPMMLPPRAGHFPRRNRIVSGLALGVLVVEAARRSGALITARLAVEDHGRDAWAVPGPVDAPCSAGCLELLRDGGAALATAPRDILELLGASGVLRAAAARPPLGRVEHLVLELLREVGPASPGELIARSGAAASEVLAAVTFLQVHGLVEREGASSRLKNSVVG